MAPQNKVAAVLKCRVPKNPSFWHKTFCPLTSVLGPTPRCCVTNVVGAFLYWVVVGLWQLESASFPFCRFVRPSFFVVLTNATSMFFFSGQEYIWIKFTRGANWNWVFSKFTRWNVVYDKMWCDAGRSKNRERERDRPMKWTKKKLNSRCLSGVKW